MRDKTEAEGKEEKKEKKIVDPKMEAPEDFQTPQFILDRTIKIPGFKGVKKGKGKKNFGGPKKKGN